MLVLTSDHFIRNTDLFRLVMQVAVQVARKDYLVTLGVTPTFRPPDMAISSGVLLCPRSSIIQSTG